ncbi:hypothetical protein CONPUDRAFT_116452 [Coniophora puteana RWD-64-598 SS2]|uniref:Cora-domain-containing protein n=1 Tax=Coniophora puteana (strain RWD-64-598) TaxID=741705 RepID=A0A5M3N7Y0_CONPW|nr:uncharacterized protein CONPUDRAFT_116452 [Coniophora puteana RWD-64-598 SS2]EIW87267.1 hypothetical protein CONPUDRAFT_116452 [Coniophora puteana RWD-64-598 SS2]
MPSDTLTPPVARAAPITPLDRFRSAARKIIQMHRTSAILARFASASTTKGFEPGIDPRRHTAALAYGHVHAQCVIQCADYSALRASFGRMSNAEFVAMLSDDGACAREPWAKVRWINIWGISWDVLSALALRYELHPLALEDVLHQRGHARSKADYYPSQLFVRVLCHMLGDPDEDVLAQYAPEETSRSASPEPMRGSDYRDEDEEKTLLEPAWKRGHSDLEAPSKSGFKFVSPTRKESVARKRRERAQITLEALKKEGRVNVKVSPMSIFLLRNGTVITILPSSTHDFTEPIQARLRQQDSFLRRSADPSLLVQSLLDIVVDSALEVVDAYHEKILELEHDVLLKPDMKVVQRLHILSGDLTLHKRTLEPLKSVIYGLRRYDLERCAALADELAHADSRQNSISFAGLPSGGAPEGPAKVPVKGFMSPKTKIYLADVHDHMEYILGSLDMFAGIAENLINYTFNVKSYEMNEVMRRLTLATIIFLPLTLLTGYFGMNFSSMWSTAHHTDWLFWAIAIPIMCVVIPAFTAPDIRRLAHYGQKRMVAWKTDQSLRYMRPARRSTRS